MMPAADATRADGSPEDAASRRRRGRPVLLPSVLSNLVKHSGGESVRPSLYLSGYVDGGEQGEGIMKINRIWRFGAAMAVTAGAWIAATSGAAADALTLSGSVSDAGN